MPASTTACRLISIITIWVAAEIDPFKVMLATLAVQIRLARVIRRTRGVAIIVWARADRTNRTRPPPTRICSWTMETCLIALFQAAQIASVTWTVIIFNLYLFSNLLGSNYSYERFKCHIFLLLYLKLRSIKSNLVCNIICLQLY